MENPTHTSQGENGESQPALEFLRKENADARTEHEETRKRLENASGGLRTDIDTFTSVQRKRDELVRKRDVLERWSYYLAQQTGQGCESIKGVFDRDIRANEGYMLFLEKNPGQDTNLDALRAVYASCRSLYEENLDPGDGRDGREIGQQYLPQDDARQKRVADAVVGMKRSALLARSYRQGTLLSEQAGSPETVQEGQVLARSQEFVRLGMREEDIDTESYGTWCDRMGGKATALFACFTKELQPALGGSLADERLRSIHNFCVDQIERYKTGLNDRTNADGSTEQTFGSSAAEMAAVEESLAWLEVGLQRFDAYKTERMPVDVLFAAEEGEGEKVEGELSLPEPEQAPVEQNGATQEHAYAAAEAEQKNGYTLDQQHVLYERAMALARRVGRAVDDGVICRTCPRDVVTQYERDNDTYVNRFNELIKKGTTAWNEEMGQLVDEWEPAFNQFTEEILNKRTYTQY